MSKNNISFILHKPQLSENIGACARAIKNFNFKKLIVVNPKPIFPNDKILATSVGAKDIIKQSKNYDTLEKAVSKIDIVIATSARFRNKNIKHINLEDLTVTEAAINDALASGASLNVLSMDEFGEVLNSQEYAFSLEQGVNAITPLTGASETFLDAVVGENASGSMSHLPAIKKS